MNDLRYALRQLRKAPIFAAVAVLTLALGIGANTAIFTLLDQALIRSLPVSHPEQLVRLRYIGGHKGNINYYGGDEHDYFSYPMYRELRDGNHAFSGLLANDEAEVGVQWKGQPALEAAELVSGNYFDVLGVHPALGRLFVSADDAAQNGNPVVVLSFNYWKTRFASDPGVIGAALMVNAQPFTIVGVAQPGFRSVISGYAPKVFFPMMTKPLVTPGWNDLDNVGSAWLTIVARLKPGESLAAAEAAINPLWKSARAQHLAQIEDSQPPLASSEENAKLLLIDNSRGFSPLRDQIAVPLLIVMGMVGLVLLMACVNVSSLLLVRAAGRVREMSIRYSVGATRWQVIRQLFVEGLVLGVVGGLLGLALAPAVSSILLRNLPIDSASDLPFSGQPDHRILLFNFGLAIVVSLLFSFAPALRFLRPDLVSSLKQQTATAAGRPLRFRRLSVGLQISLSLLLLIGAGLFVRTVRNLRAADVGFAVDQLVSFGIDPELAGYKAEQIVPLHQRILHLLTAQPGVSSVAGNADPELMGMESMTTLAIAGQSPYQTIRVEAPSITPRYFETLGIPLLAGRDFTDQDVTGKPPVAVVNLQFARRHFGDPGSAVGKFLRQGRGKDQTTYQIIGVVADTKHVDMRTGAMDTLYRALYQSKHPGGLQFYVRTLQAPEAAKATIQAVMRQLDPNLVVDGLRMMDEQIAQSIANERIIAMLAVSFGALAVLMAAIGVYGVLAYATSQRTREIGIRMALGARRQAVMRLVVADVAWLAGISIVVTLPFAILLSRTLRSQLYNVSPADPLVIASGVLLVAFVVIVSALLPARRAAHVEPMQALRME